MIRSDWVGIYAMAGKVCKPVGLRNLNRHLAEARIKASFPRQTASLYRPKPELNPFNDLLTFCSHGLASEALGIPLLFFSRRRFVLLQSPLYVIVAQLATENIRTSYTPLARIDPRSATCNLLPRLPIHHGRTIDATISRISRLE